MEKKTIGGFIATLRKANGMTQKELAEKLCVSDKTVSRWERDEGTPELSIIPVIAEIFGVTCDELLRGERKSPAERLTEEERRTAQMSGTEEEVATPKAMKQRQRILKATYSNYRTLSVVAMGISAVGLIVALICNLALLKALLGFLFGMLFFVTSIVCQVAFLNRAFLKVEDAELDMETLSEFKHRVIHLAEISIGVTVGLVGFTCPLVLVDAYMGLSADSLLLYGMIGAVVLLMLYAVICYFLKASLLRRGVYHLKGREEERYYHNHRLIRNCAIVLAILVMFTFVGHQFATIIWGPGSIMQGTTFHDYESFIAYMGQDIPAEPQVIYGEEAPAPDVAIEVGEIIYYDENGNEITEEEARHKTLKDINGTVVCEYIDRNESVISLRYSPKDGTVLPITICTQEDLRLAEATARARHVYFGFAYACEVLAILFVYAAKRMKK